PYVSTGGDYECARAADKRKLVLVCLDMEQNPVLDLTIHVLIILSTVFLAIDSHGSGPVLKSVLRWGNMAISAAFSVEMAIKVTGRGLTFFRKKFRVFDFCAVLFSVASDVLVLLHYQVGVQIRFLRLFRLVYVARSWDTLFYLLNMLLSLFEPLLLLLAIISLVVVALALLAGDVFVEGPLSSEFRWNYEDFFHSVLLIVRVFCGEMFEPLLDCFQAGQGRVKCVPFYVVVLFLGNYVLLNVFLAFLLSNFSVEKIVERNSPGEMLFERIMCRTKSWLRRIIQGMQRIKNKHSKFPALPGASIMSVAYGSAQRKARNTIEHRAFRALVALLIGLSSVVLWMENDDAPERVRRRLALINSMFTAMLSVEVMLVLVAIGPRQYFTSGWHLLDFFVQMTSLLYEVLEMAGLEGSLSNALRATRALRPMRIISLLPGMKLLVDALAASVPSIGNVLVVCAFIWVIFGVVGVSMFSGRLYSCVDSDGDPMDPDVVPDRETCHMLGFSWENAQINFDNLADASLALLQVATFEGWIDVAERAMDISGVDLQPRLEANRWSLLYFALFLVVGAFLVFNLFVGVVIDSFYAKKREATEDSYCCLTEPAANEAQKRYVRSLRRLISRRPVRMVPRPTGRLRAFLYDVAGSKELKLVSAILVLLDGMLLASEAHNWSHGMRRSLGKAHVVFLIGFAFELGIHAGAAGGTFLASKWRQFELCTLLLSLLGSVCLPLARPLDPQWALLRGLRALAVLNVFRSLVNVRGVRQMVLIFAASVPAFTNVAMLLFLVMFVYAVLGVSLFGQIIPDDTDRFLVNFGRLWRALLLLFRLSTSSSWNDLLPWLMPAGKALAVTYIVTYIFVSSFIIFNSYVAVLLDGYEHSRNTELSGMTDSDLVEYAAGWARLDLEARGLLPLAAVPVLLDSLPPPLRLPLPNRLSLAIMDVPILKGDRVHYVHLLEAMLRVRMNMYEPLSPELSRSLEVNLATAYPELKNPDMVPVSSTMVRQLELRSARVLTEFFKAGCERLRQEHAARILQRNFRARRFRRAVHEAKRVVPFPLVVLTTTNLQYW
ncbi:unnamed protein product, partial [Ixodes hexagonus]